MQHLRVPHQILPSTSTVVCTKRSKGRIFKLGLHLAGIENDLTNLVMYAGKEEREICLRLKGDESSVPLQRSYVVQSQTQHSTSFPSLPNTSMVLKILSKGYDVQHARKSTSPSIRLRSKLIPREESILEQRASENTSLTKDHRLAMVYKVNFG